MLGFSPRIGLDPKTPQFQGPANIMWDGRYLWVGNRGYYGQDTDLRNKLLWVLDIKSEPPKIIKKIDLSPYDDNFNVTRNVRLSNNGLYAYACLAGSPGTAGRVLIIDIRTYQVIGNAEVTTASIGSPTGHIGGRPVDALDDGSDHLWVVNSNQFNQNGMERFSLSACIANGLTPTTSLQVVSLTTHAEELAFLNGYIWSGGSDWSNNVLRMNPVDGSYSVYAPPGADLTWGMTALNGALWSGNFADQVYRFEPIYFGSPNFLTDTITVTTPNSTSTLNTFAFDGTYVWTAVGSEGSSPDTRRTYMYRLAGSPGSMSIAATIPITRGPINSTAGCYQIIYDGQFIWGGQRFIRLINNAAPDTLNGDIVKVQVTPGAEKQLTNYPTGGVVSNGSDSNYVNDVVSPKSVWVVDGGQAYAGSNAPSNLVTKVDTTDPTNPTLTGIVDVSAYGGASKRVRTNNGFVYVGLFPLSAANGNRPGNTNDPAPFVIINGQTNTIVGLGSVSTGGDLLRPTDFAFDGNGFVYALAQNTQTGKTKIYKYNINSVLAAYPSVYSSPTAKFTQGNHPSGHFENLTYGAGFLWGVPGQQQNQGVLVQVDPSTGSEVVYTEPNASGKYINAYFAFGSIWVSGGNSQLANKVMRFNPGTFPSAPIYITVDPTNTISNTCEMTSDSTSIWITNGSNFVTALPSVWRVSAGSNTVIANPSATGLTSPGSTQGITFDGASIWATLRFSDTPNNVGLVGFTIGVGTESYLERYNPGGIYVDPNGIAT